MTNEKILIACVKAGTSHDNKLFFAVRHCTAVREAKREFNCGWNRIKEGFFTSKGNFVDRKQAYKIALEAGQIVAGQTLHESELFSEDLY